MWIDVLIGISLTVLMISLAIYGVNYDNEKVKN